jgi:hypothetical protein
MGGIFEGRTASPKGLEFGRMNVKVASEPVDDILRKVRELGVRKKGLVYDHEFKDVEKKVLKEKF